MGHENALPKRWELRGCREREKRCPPNPAFLLFLVNLISSIGKLLKYKTLTSNSIQNQLQLDIILASNSRVGWLFSSGRQSSARLAGVSVGGNKCTKTLDTTKIVI
jgi:hypothetical protein